jgi:hypothetical protein
VSPSCEDPQVLHFIFESAGLNSENEEQIDRATTFLSRMQKQLPDRVAELLEPYAGSSDAWRNRLIFIIQWADISAGRQFFELFLRLIDDGTLDDARGPIAVNSDFWSLIYSLPKEEPEWACEVVAHYLNRRLTLNLTADQPNSFERKKVTIPDSQSDEHIFLESAHNAPEAFTLKILPIVLNILDLNSQQDEELLSESVWTTANFISEHLIVALENALSKLAEAKSEILINIVSELRDSNFELSQYLLIRVYTASGERFANEAIDHFCARPSRLKASYSYSNRYGASHKLLEVITLYCSNDKLEQLETMLLNYYPDEEKGGTVKQYHGHAQFILLDGIVSSRRSEATSRRLAELYRKFNRQPNSRYEGEIIANDTSPAIPRVATEKMTNEQWLKAIAKYNLTESNHLENGSFVDAQAIPKFLEEQVRKQPERFSELIFKFPDNTHQLYFDAVLRGIAEAEEQVNVQIALRVLQRCHHLPKRPCGQSISWLFQKLVDLPWTISALEILNFYALNDPNPEQESWRIQASDSPYGGDILTAGINSTRRSAVHSVARLIFADKNRTGYFLSSLQQVVQDPSISIRSCAAEALTAVLNYDRDLAVSLFLELCKAEDPLLGTQYIELFLHYALSTHYQQLLPILERMINSDLPEVVMVGARQACLLSMTIEEASPLAKRCFDGTEVHRMSAAEILAANLHLAHHREFCEDGLIQLFNDPDEKVRNKAAKCFSKLDWGESGHYNELVRAFVDSPAFVANCGKLIRALQKTEAKLPEATCLICEKFIDSLGEATADIRTHYAGIADTASELLIRVYSQSRDQALQSRCLDVVDRMVRFGTYGLDRALQPFER